MRWAWATLIVLASTACGELGMGAPSPTGITITLTDTGCTASGVGALLPDQFKATLVNKTSSVLFLAVKRLDDGRAYAELDAHVQERQQRIATSGPNFELPPPMATDQVRFTVDPRQTNTVDATLSSGTYGLVCRRDQTTRQDPRGGTAEAIYLIGPFRVV